MPCNHEERSSLRSPRSVGSLRSLTFELPAAPLVIAGMVVDRGYGCSDDHSHVQHDVEERGRDPGSKIVKPGWEAASGSAAITCAVSSIAAAPVTMRA